MQKQIDYLHSQVGGKEWSGPLIYRIVEGDISDPDNLRIVIEDMFLMDIGTAGYTAFEMDGQSSAEMMDMFPIIETGEARIGLIHTHHNMRTFFSGTDQEELRDNARDYNAYLSLIVGIGSEPKARIAFPGQVTDHKKKVLTYKDISGNEIVAVDESDEAEEVVYFYECEIEYEEVPLQQKYKDRYELVKERGKSTAVVGFNSKHYNGTKKKTRYGHTPSTYGTYGKNYGRQQNFFGHQDFDDPSDEYDLNVIERFLCIMCTGNPTSTARNLWAVLNGMKDKQGPTATRMVNILDLAMEDAVGKDVYSDMDFEDKISFLQEAQDYLNDGDTKNLPLSEKFTLGGDVEAVLASILDMNEQGQLINPDE